MSGGNEYLGNAFALATAIIWAIAVILFKKSGEKVHPIALNLFKCVLAFVLLIPTMLLFGESLMPNSSLKIYAILFASGIVGIGISDTLFFVGLNHLGAGLSAIAGYIYSPFIIILSFAMLGESFTPIQAVGTILVISAIFTANADRRSGKLLPGDLRKGLTAVVLGNAAIAISVIMMKPYLAESPLIWSAEIRLAGGILTLLLMLLFHPKRKRILSSLKSVGSLKYTLSGSLFGTYFAMVLWIAGMKYTQASTAAVLNQTSDIFVFILAAIFLREHVTRYRLIGIILAICGAIMVSLGG